MTQNSNDDNHRAHAFPELDLDVLLESLSWILEAFADIA